jgi:hypothetical protein
LVVIDRSVNPGRDASGSFVSTVGIPRQQRADTVIRVSRGARLELGGRITADIRITTTDRDEVRFVGPGAVRLTETGGVVRLDAGAAGGRDGRGRPGRGGGTPGGSDADYQVTVPRWMPISVDNARGDVTIEGSEAEVQVVSQGGAVRIIGGRGRVSGRSVSGSVYVENVQGSVSAFTVMGSLRVIGVTGDVRAESTNGNITLDQVDARSLTASSNNGNIEFNGTVRNDGVYSMTTHNGRVSMVIPEDANATVTVSTFNGRYSASFPIQVTRIGADRRFTFVVGNGSARVEASSFNGNIAFRRPGQPRPTG